MKPITATLFRVPGQRALPIGQVARPAEARHFLVPSVHLCAGLGLCWESAILQHFLLVPSLGCQWHLTVSERHP